MPENANTPAATEPQEITKENIEAIANAWAETEAGEIQGPYRAIAIAKLRTHWYSGFLAHAKLMEPYNAEAALKIEELYSEVENVRKLLQELQRLVEDFESEHCTEPYGEILDIEPFTSIKKILQVKQ